LGKTEKWQWWFIGWVDTVFEFFGRKCKWRS
jgi:hypothetical protein